MFFSPKYRIDLRFNPQFSFSMTDYDGLKETFCEDLKQTSETFNLGVSSWMYTGGGINPAVWVEDTAIVMNNHGPDYEVLNIAQIEDLEDESNYTAESTTWELLEDEELGYEEKLEDVLADINDYTDIAAYLDKEDVVIEGVNDELNAIVR